LGLRLVNKNIPSALIVVAFGIFISWMFELEQQGLKVIGKMPQGLPFPNAAALSIPFDLLLELIPDAISMFAADDDVDDDDALALAWLREGSLADSSVV